MKYQKGKHYSKRGGRGILSVGSARGGELSDNFKCHEEENLMDMKCKQRQCTGPGVGKCLVCSK